MSAPVVIALHYQNDVLHPDGRIRVGLADDAPRAALIAAAGQLLSGARARQWPIVHIRIAFRPDYADLARNTPIFRDTEKLGACRDGDWGSEYFAALAPAQSPCEFALAHTRISGFYGTQLEPLLQLLAPGRSSSPAWRPTPAWKARCATPPTAASSSKWLRTPAPRPTGPRTRPR